MKYLLLSLSFLVSFNALAQRKKESQPVPEPAKASVTPIEAKIAGLKKYPGFIEFYYDEKQDKVLMLIDKFNSELLYVESLAAGVGSNDLGLDRNSLGRDRVIRFERRGPKVLMVEPNYAFRAISNDAAERRAVEEAFAQSVLWGFTILAEEGGKVLVDATDFLLQDAHDITATLQKKVSSIY